MIKKSFSTGISTGAGDIILLILRLSFGLFMITHGWPKFQSLIGDEPIQFASVLGLSETTSLALTVFSEFFCSILIIIGLATRFATIPLILTMVVAAFVIHADDPFSNKEMALHYLVVYLVLLIAGAGRFSFDHFIAGGRRR